MLNPVLELSSSDVRAMLKKLKEIEPGAVTAYRREIKRIAKPVADQIKTNIPLQPPLSGMGLVVNEGRLNWFGAGRNEGKGSNKKPRSVTVSSAIKRNQRSLTTPIARVILNSPAVSMADMAGRATNGTYGKLTREYTYRKRNGELVKRRHRINGQGANMIRQLSSRYSRASRFGWPGLEKQIDNVSKEIDKVLQTYFNKAFGGR